MAESICTTCPYCGVGCGVEARVEGAQVAGVTGSASHPANQGRLCVKGSALHETTHLQDRLLHPRIDGTQVDWSTALDAVADGLQRIVAEHGPQAVAFYGSGQLLTEDYYVANKLMKGFIGSANLDTNSRLCMASAVASYKRALGEDAVPCCYEDLEQCDLLILVGSNAAWTHPILYQRMQAAKQARPQMKVVVVDPRRTASCDLADLHLPIAPGSDVALYNGLLHFAEQQDLIDADYIDRHTEGWADCRAAASAWSLEATAAFCQVPARDLQQLYDWFAAAPQTLSFYSQGVNQSTSGVDKCHAILNLHLATGRIGQPGMGPFSITGQPNAMGGREVGGLANQLAAHMDLENPGHRDRVRRFWQAPHLADKPGLKAVELFQAIEAGTVKAVWIMATNPVVSLPDADQVRRALQQCELVIVSDNMDHTDTGRLAHVLLPACGWSEKDGTVTNSERRISRQRALVVPAGDSRPDWWILTQVAQRMGFAEQFPYQHPQQIFVEHAALSGFENAGERLFDISALSSLDREAYDDLQPIQWPVNTRHPQGCARLFGDGRFSTPSGRARFFGLQPRPTGRTPSARYPWILNTGRLRDQWHTMTRTGLAPRLLGHTDRPWLYMNPQDAARAGLEEEDLARISSENGQARMQVRLDDGLRPGTVFAPMHWSAHYAGSGRIGAVVNPCTDPISGQPESKHTPVRIEVCSGLSWAVLMSETPIDPQSLAYWVRVPLEQGWRYELATDTPHDWMRWLQQLLPPDAVIAQYRDTCTRDQRWLAYCGEQVVAMLHTRNRPRQLPERALLDRLWGSRDKDPLALAAGRPGSGTDAGRTVCSCFGVGINTIRQSIESGCQSVTALGEQLRCGTNCGSCIPELNQIIQQTPTLEKAS